MPAETLLHAQQLSRYYGDRRAVHDLQLRLQQGEVLGLLGPNGAGKSTTMNMLSGNLAPSHGSIEIAGHDLLSAPKGAKRHLGYLPEQPPVYRDMTVDEYLRYSAALHGLKGSACRQALDQAKQRCALEEVGRRLIGQLSKGFQQRVGIAQAILHNPSVIILDEPTVGLDPIQIHDIRQLIRELAVDHSVILSTHILPEVQAVCDRVQIINRGETVFSDDLADLESRHAEPVLNVQFTRDVPATEILALGAVVSADTLANQHWRIVFEEGSDLPERLAETAIQRGWGLRELSQQRTSLERIFMSLIYQENTEEHTA